MSTKKVERTSDTGYNLIVVNVVTGSAAVGHIYNIAQDANRDDNPR